MSQGSDFPDRPLEIGLAEKIARLGVDLPTYNLLAGKVITIDYDVVQGGLLTLGDPHLDVDRVSLDVQLDRSDLEEQVTLVSVQLRHVIISLFSSSGEPLGHSHHVIWVALVDLENAVELLRRVDGVSSPSHVPEVVFLSLVELEVDRQAVRFDIVDGILHDSSVTVTRLVELADEVQLVVRIFLLIELLAAEEIIDLIRLGFLHRFGKLEVGDSFVALEIDVPDADLVALVDREIDTDSVLDYGVLLGLDIDIAIQEAFLGIVFLDDSDRGGRDIIGEFTAPAQTKPLLKVFLFILLDAGE